METQYKYIYNPQFQVQQIPLQFEIIIQLNICTFNYMSQFETCSI
jgi:hypothetical protein